jgi:tetratricopeptide (TPR) repeat protein
MSFLDRFKRQPPTQADTALRDAVITAASSKDFATLATLCKANTQAIRGSFEDWLICPAEIKDNAAAMQRYVEGLFLVATLFKQLGDETLMRAITTPDENPMSGWEGDLKEAERLVEAGHPAGAATLLEATLASTEGMRGTGIDHYRPRILGRLGIALYRAGDWRRGADATRRALALCKEAGDEEGVRAYTANLDVIEQRRQFVLLNVDGRDVSEPVTGKFRYEIRGGEPVPPEAETLHQQGRAAGARGDYEEALQTLTEAATLAPYWPYPVYDRAFTHLLLNDLDAALADYQRTVQLAPRGFFMALTALDTLQREAKGEFPRGLFLAFLRLEEVADPVRRRDILHQLVEQQPRFAPAWLKCALLAEGPPARLEAIERGLAANPDPETKGLLLTNKALTLRAAGNRDAAVQLLRGLLTDSASTSATEAIARDALTRFGASSVSEGM